jgi:DNA adenine methylase
MLLPTELDPALEQIPVSPIPAVNVATVPQRSPLRYPGGKTWLVPHVRAWLSAINPSPEVLVEPFAGGAIVSLTAVMEGLAERCVMSEIDPDVAAFWKAALWHSDELIERVHAFVPTRESIAFLNDNAPDGVVSRGFRTLVLNRTRRGGILANGASLARVGESGKGVASRWYPETISRRIRAIAKHTGRIDFRETDGLEMLRQLSEAQHSRTALFVDPPYTAAGKGAGKRLYNHNLIDHTALFRRLAQSEADFLMTYDQSPEIMDLTRRHGFHVQRVNMKNTHHAQIWELLITRQPVF